MTNERSGGDRMTFLKYFFAAACCSASAGFATVAYSVESQAAPSPAIAPVLLTPFALLLIVARLLQARGMRSESWAFLAYGSWLLVPGMMLSHVLFERHLHLDVRLVFGLLLLCVFVCFAVAGVRAALRNRWGEIGGWWFGSLPLILLTGLFWISWFMD